jgi:hypothetical protein
MVVQASLVRFHAFVALRHSLTTATRAVADAQIRDILKQAKAALNDKALVVQRSACEVRPLRICADSRLIST